MDSHVLVSSWTLAWSLAFACLEQDQLGALAVLNTPRAETRAFPGLCTECPPRHKDVSVHSLLLEELFELFLNSSAAIFCGFSSGYPSALRGEGDCAVLVD